MQQSTMTAAIRKLASLRLTLVGIAALGISALLGARTALVDTNATVVPIVLLSVNLIAAILTNRSFRTQTGLLVFHFALLLVFVLNGLTVLTRFDGHVEVLEGAAFDARQVEVSDSGWLHRGRLRDIAFVQGDIQVEYLPGLIRQATRSRIEYVEGSGGEGVATIGDKVAAVFSGYRFVTTFNKGFAPVMRWRGSDGVDQYGAVHFPSYPEFDWNQATTWTTPTGQQLRMELEFEVPILRTSEAWLLQRPTQAYGISIHSAEVEPITLGPGDSIDLQQGSLHIEELRMWMAYRIDYFPLLPWMFVAALIGIVGLSAHLVTRQRSARRSSQGAQTTAGDAYVSCT